MSTDSEEASEESTFSTLWESTKEVGKSLVKPLSGAATVGAGYGGGHGLRMALDKFGRGSLNKTLQGISKNAPLGGAVLGSLVAPLVAEKFGDMVRGEEGPRVIQIEYEGEEIWVVTELPHLAAQPRLINHEGEVVVEGIPIVDIEVVALSSDDEVRFEAEHENVLNRDVNVHHEEPVQEESEV